MVTAVCKLGDVEGLLSQFGNGLFDFYSVHLKSSSGGRPIIFFRRLTGDPAFRDALFPVDQFQLGRLGQVAYMIHALCRTDARLLVVFT